MNFYGKRSECGKSDVFLKRLPLRVNFSWTFIGNVVYAACQWGMLIVLSKFGSPEMVGRFVLGLAVTAPVFMFTNLQLRAVQATDAKRDYEFGDYLCLRLATTTLAVLVIAGIVVASTYSWETAGVVLCVGIAKAFESVSDVFYGLLQQHEQMDRIAKSMMLKGVLSLATLGIVVFVTRNVLWGTVGLLVSWAVVLFTYDMGSAKRLLPAGYKLRRIVFARWHHAALLNLTQLSLPLGFVMLLISLNTNIPRYFVKLYLGEDALGIFAAIAYSIVAGTTVVSALGQSASPRLAKYYAHNNQSAFLTLLFKLIVIGAGLGGAGVLVSLIAGREILTFLYQPEYAQKTLFVWVMIAAAFGYIGSFLGYGITATRQFRRFILPYIGVTLITVAASGLLIPLKGLEGAAWSLGITSLAQCLFSIPILAAINRTDSRELTS